MYYTKVNESYIPSNVLMKLLNISNPKIDISDYSLDCIVEWDLEIDSKPSGINGMEIVIHSIVGEIYWTTYVSDNLTEDDISNLVDNGDAELVGEDEIEGFIKINSPKQYLAITDYDFEWSADKSLSVYPQEINFLLVDDNNIQMTVNF
jgi:hypothetical protein